MDIAHLHFGHITGRVPNLEKCRYWFLDEAISSAAYPAAFRVETCGDLQRPDREIAVTMSKVQV
uniref:Uncharacterized protein n=1 Tax=Hydrogenophaga sp. PL2G6 TaxID=503997 RepID=B4Y319_9BURK|nr:hypothetical protein [Hydrogenophaga sp. PL2G6]